MNAKKYISPQNAMHSARRPNIPTRVCNATQIPPKKTPLYENRLCMPDFPIPFTISIIVNLGLQSCRDCAIMYLQHNLTGVTTMKRDSDFWNAEADYIESVDPSRPGESFNSDPACFQRYVTMQHAAAERDGATEAARRIAKRCRSVVILTCAHTGEPIT